MLNNMPWFKFERNEFGAIVVTEYFMRGQRGQWAGEGYIVSILVTLTGLGYLFLNNADRFFKDRFTIRLSIYAIIASIFIL